MNINVKEEVLDDLTAIVKWYEKQSTNLGIRFLDEWEKALSDISNNPFACQVKYKKFRHFRIKHFPYLIIFEIEKSSIVIVYAVIHGHRNPRSRYRRK